MEEVPGQHSMGIFVFPPFSKIPLHDHPGMCVLSRVLYGSLERLSLDLPKDREVTDSRSNSTHKGIFNSFDSHCRMSWRNLASCQGTRAFKKRVDYLEAPDCTVLYPFEGNLHEFHAGPHGAAVLDVLFPPYEDHDRDCTFYHVVDDIADKIGNSFWLIPTGQPEDFHCVSGRYRTLGADD